MTSKEKLLQLRHDFYSNEPLDYDSISYFASIERDLEILELLKSNIIDYFVQYGDDHEAYNTATMTIQVKALKEFTEKMAGKEIHYTPCKSISNNDFELLIDMRVKEKNQ